MVQGDIIVGVVGHDVTPGGGEGAVYGYRGSADGIPAARNFTLVGETAGDFFGFVVQGVGDTNGDGYDDLATASPEYPGGGSTGRTYVYYGAVSGTPTGPTAIDSPVPTGFFGYVASAGDINGDGFNDIVSGAPRANGGSNGAAYTFLGSASGVATVPTNSWTRTVADAFGYARPARDFNGDGFPDIVVGAPGFDNGALNGQVNIFNGSADGASDTPTQRTGENADDLFGVFIQLITP